VGREGRMRLGMGEEGKKEKRRALRRGREDMYSGLKDFFLGFCFCFHCFAATQPALQLHQERTQMGFNLFSFFLG